MPKFGAITLPAFERAFDELFDELLTTPWRCGQERGEFERADIVDLQDRYEVRIAVPREHARKVSLEVRGQRLSLRAPSGVGGLVESTFSFSEAIDSERVAARWAQNVLSIIVPKAKGKRVPLKVT